MARLEEPDANHMQIYNDEKWIHIASIMMPRQPGFALFTTTLEYNFFPPRTDKNKDFKLMTVKWGKTVWFVVSIPATEMLIASSTAQFCGLEMIRKSPIMMGIPGLPSESATIIAFATQEELEALDIQQYHPFPIQSKAMHILDKSFQYKLFPDEDIMSGDWLEKENAMIDDILGDDIMSEDDTSDITKQFNEFLKD